MGMKNLVAKAHFSYATRRLVPGEPFQAKDRDARVLTAIGRAEYAREPGRIASPSQSLVAKAGGTEMKALRAEYERKMGKKPFTGWNEAQLREKMAAF